MNKGKKKANYKKAQKIRKLERQIEILSNQLDMPYNEAGWEVEGDWSLIKKWEKKLKKLGVTPQSEPGF